MSHVFLAILFSFSLFGPKQQETSNDPAAADLMAEVSNKYKSHQNIHASFILDIYNPHGDSEIQDGEVWLEKEQFRIEMPGQSMVSDGKNIWVLMDEVMEAQIDYYTPDEESIDPSQLFTMYETDFLYKVKGSLEEDGKTLRIIEMTPLDKEQTYFKVDVTIDPESLLITEVKVYERSGVRYTYSILIQESNASFPDNHFSYTTEALEGDGYSIIDLR